MNQSTSQTTVHSSIGSTQLRPYSVALSQSWGIFKRKFWKLLGIELFGYLPLIVFVAVVVVYFVTRLGIHSAKDVTQSVPLLQSVVSISFGVIALIALLLFVVFLYWGQVAKLMYLKYSDSGLTAGQAIRGSWSRLSGYALVNILYVLKVIIGFILLIVPGIVWYVKHLFSPYMAVFDRDRGARGKEALRMSAELIRGYRWGIYARILATGLLLSLVQFAVQFGFSIVQGGFALTGAKALFGIGFIMVWIIAGIVGISIRLFQTIYEYVLYEEVSSIKQTQPEATHRFSSAKKSLIIISLLLVSLIPIGVLGVMTYTTLNTAREKENSAGTIAMAYQIQTALELYRMDHAGYPVGERIRLGTEEFMCLDQKNGFGSICNSGSSLSFATMKARNDSFVYSQTNNGNDFILSFYLPTFSGGFAAGERIMTSQGILEAGEEPVIGKPIETPPDSDQNEDLDNDGLSNEDEVLWKTNPNNPDSDADGYSDGEEVKNGYHPNGTGKIISSKQSVRSENDFVLNRTINGCAFVPKFASSFSSARQKIVGVTHSAQYSCPNGSLVIILIFDAGAKRGAMEIAQKEIVGLYEFLRYQPYQNNEFVYLSDSTNTIKWTSAQYFVDMQFTSGENASGIDPVSLEAIVDAYIGLYPPEDPGVVKR